MTRKVAKRAMVKWWGFPRHSAAYWGVVTSPKGLVVADGVELWIIRALGLSSSLRSRVAV